MLVEEFGFLRIMIIMLVLLAMEKLLMLELGHGSSCRCFLVCMFFWCKFWFWDLMVLL